MDSFKFHPAKELESLFAFCRELAIEKRKYAISAECFIYIFLCHSNLADIIFNLETKNELKTIFYNKFNQETSDKEYYRDASIPLYLELEEILKNADYYKNKCNQQELTSIHVLMSILSYENFTSKIFAKKGFFYLDVAQLTDQSMDFLSSIKRARYFSKASNNEFISNINNQLNTYEITVSTAQQIAIEKKKFAISPACFFLALLQTQEIQEFIIDQSTKKI